MSESRPSAYLEGWRYVCVCVCVCVRERERERVCVCVHGCEGWAGGGMTRFRVRVSSAAWEGLGLDDEGWAGGGGGSGGGGGGGGVYVRVGG